MSVPDALKDDYSVEKALKALIYALQELARLRAWTEDKLKAVHLDVAQKKAFELTNVSMDPQNLITYARLFGITPGSSDQYWGTYPGHEPNWKQWRNWKINRQRVPDRRLSQVHIEKIHKTLMALDVASYIPEAVLREDRLHQRTFLEKAVDDVARQIAIAEGQTSVQSAKIDFGIASEFHVRLADFLGLYVGSDARPVAFGGRDRELRSLDAWLADERAAPRQLVTSLAGRGKTSLLLQWIQKLQQRKPLEEDPWEVAFMPASIRAGTNNARDLYAGLARRLSQLSGVNLAIGSSPAAEDFCDAFRSQLSLLATKGRRVLVIIDGLDEIPDGELPADIVPATLPPNIRVLVAARLQLGDIDPSGWVRRLSWNRHVQAEQAVQLAPLDASGIADIMSQLGRRAKSLAKNDKVLKDLVKVTGGDPILVRFYAEELASHPRTGAALEPEELGRITPGLDGYFTHWMEAQKWDREAKQQVNQDDIWAALAILSFARGPLPARDFLQLFAAIHKRSTPPTEYYLLQPLKRFVIGNGDPEHGYILNHPSIGQYLRGQRFHGRAQEIETTLLATGQAELRKLNRDELAPSEASPYFLRYLRQHFQDAVVSSSEWMELVENGRRLAWEHARDGYRPFADDVKAALAAVSSDDQAATIAARWRCALVLSSIRTIGFNTSGPLILAAVRKGLLTHKQAINLARTAVLNIENVGAILRLALEPGIEPRDSETLTAVAMRALKPVGAPSTTANRRGLVEDLAKEIEEVLAAQSFEFAVWAAPVLGPAFVHAVSLFHDEGHQYVHRLERTWLKEGKHWEVMDLRRRLNEAGGVIDSEERCRIVREALNSIPENADPIHVSGAIRWLAPYLSPDDVGGVFEWVSSMTDDQVRAEALDRIVPRLARDHLLAVLAKSAQCMDRAEIAEVLSVAVKYMTAEDRASTIAYLLPVTNNSKPWTWENVVRYLLEFLTQEQIAELFEFALVAEPELPLLLCTLAPRLNVEQIEKAMAVAERIEDQGQRADTLGALAKNLPVQIRRKVLATLLERMHLMDPSNRELYIFGLAPHLSGEHTLEALQVLQKVNHGKLTWYVLEHLAQDLSAEYAATALSIARSIHDDDQARLSALATLARFLLEPELHVLLRSINDLACDEDRAELLVKILPHLPKTEYAHVTSSALHASKTVGHAQMRGSRLVGLAAYLTEQQLADALATAHQMPEQDVRATTLGRLSAYVPPDRRSSLFREALRIASGIRSDMARSYTLLALLRSADSTQVSAVVDDLIESAVRSRREWALVAMRDSIETISKIGEKRAIASIHRTVMNVVEWYP